MSVVTRLLFICLLSIPTIARAADAGFDAYFAASREFDRLSSEAALTGRAPRASNPQVAKVLAVLSDEALVRQHSFARTDFSGLQDVCGKANAANMTYTLFGAKTVEFDGSPEAYAQKIRQLADANTFTYQEEIFLLTPFLVRCMAAQLPLLVDFYESLAPADRTAARSKGMRGFRDGVYNLYVGALSSLAQQRISEANRTRLLASLADTANLYASALAIERRKGVLDLAQSIERQVSQSSRQDLERIATAMRDRSCATMCSL